MLLERLVMWVGLMSFEGIHKITTNCQIPLITLVDHDYHLADGSQNGMLVIKQHFYLIIP